MFFFYVAHSIPSGIKTRNYSVIFCCHIELCDATHSSHRYFPTSQMIQPNATNGTITKNENVGRNRILRRHRVGPIEMPYSSPPTLLDNKKGPSLAAIRWQKGAIWRHMDCPRFPWNFGEIMGDLSSPRFDPHRGQTIRRICAMDNAQWNYRHSHICAKILPVGLEPATSAAAPHAIKQLPKTTLISLISFIPFPDPMKLK